MPIHLQYIKVSKGIWDGYGESGPDDSQMSEYITEVNRLTQRNLKPAHKRNSELQKFKRHFNPLSALAYFLKKSQADIASMFISLHVPCIVYRALF